jgi:CheY-like chemotaxis protein
VRTLALVVEDEPLIRLNTVAMIEEAGYDVVEASDADEAIALLERWPSIRAVLSNIDLSPGSMDGLKLVQAVRERLPPVVLILASDRVSPRIEDLPEGTVFLRKPYAESDILKTLEAI